MGKLQEFFDNLNWHAFRSIYVWGGQGEALKDLTENKIKKMEQNTDYANRAIKMWKARKNIEGARAFDCSGLICWLMSMVGAIQKGFDTTADGLFGHCKRIARGELKAGDWVFKKDKRGKAYHVGVVVDDALNIVEAAGRDFGVVKRPISANGWNVYGRPSFFENEIGKTAVATAGRKSITWELSRLVKFKSPMMRGADVMNVQKALITNGCSVGATGADGVFGRNSDTAVRAFQRNKGLTADGIVGKDTCAALGGRWK